MKQVACPGVPRRIGANRHDPRPRIVGVDYSGVSMSRWPRSGQGCSKASVNACPGGGRTWTNAYRSHPRHPSWNAWPRSSQIPQRVAVVPTDPLDLRLQLLPGGHRNSILTPWGLAPVAREL